MAAKRRRPRGLQGRRPTRALAYAQPMDSPDPATLDAARAYLPPGVGWLNVPALFLVACTLAWVIGSVAARAGAPKQDSPLHAPWTERARTAFPMRFGARFGVGLGGIVGMVLAYVFDGPWAAVPPGALSVVGLVAGLLGGLVAADGVERKLGLPSGIGRRLRDMAAVMLLFFPHALAAGALSSVGYAVGGAARYVGSCLAVLAVTLLVLRPLALLRLTGLLRPAPERLRGVVEAMARATGTPLRGGVHVLRWSMGNAVALPLPAAVAFTDRAVEVLSDEDVEGICAHELAHLRESRGVVAIRTAASLALGIPIVVGPFVRPGLTPLLVVFGVVAFVAGQRWLQRYELVADAAAKEHEPSPGAYGRALEKLYAVNLAPAVTSKTTSHPHLYDRLVALGAEPAHPRPEPPSSWLVTRATLVGVVVAMGSGFAVMVALAMLSSRAPAHAVMITGGKPTALGDYAMQKVSDDPTAARALFRACLVARPDDRTCRAGLARLGEESR
jgi:Zn-dependent protease with chaperone function